MNTTDDTANDTTGDGRPVVRITSDPDAIPCDAG